MTIRHLTKNYGGGEHAFCGEAYDAFGSGDAEVEGVFMDDDDKRSVTCRECIDAIQSIRAQLKGRKLGRRS